jgi:hypothetical protein
LNLAWGIGSVTGPVVSGLLAQPCIQYKLPKCPTLLANYPFLLPCLGAAVFSVASIIASVSLTETNPRFVRVQKHSPDSLSFWIHQLPQCSHCLLITKWVYWSTSWIILLLVDLNFWILLLVDQLLKCSSFLIQLLNDICLLSYWSTSEWWCFFFPFWSRITYRKNPDWEACISWFSDNCPHFQDSA